MIAISSIMNTNDGANKNRYFNFNNDNNVHNTHTNFIYFETY